MNRNDISIRTQRFKEQESLRDCTFSPDIGSNSQRQNEDIVSKTRKWQAEKERKMVIQERAKVAREMAECTFSPNGAHEKIGQKFPEKYYEKSVEWQKKVEESRQKKQDELYHSIMVPYNFFIDLLEQSREIKKHFLQSFKND